MFRFILLVAALAAASLPAGAQAPVKQITAGIAHFCSLDTANTVRCWGRNFEGQIGDGTTNVANAPTPVMGLPGTIVKIANGRFFSCALNDAGEVWCWGDSSFGALQGGGGVVPARATGYPGPVAQIWSGLENLCAGLRTGQVICAGATDGYQLGNGVQFESVASPANLPDGIVEIAFIDRFPGGACALEPAGTVKCWGNAPGLTPVPADMGLTGIRRIVGGADYFCALDAAGTMKCWGGNAFGQLGIGSYARSDTPVDVIGLPGPVRDIFAGALHTCAVTYSGAAYCWGDDRYRVSGGPGGNTGVNTPRLVGGAGAGTRSIATAIDVTCLVTEAGRVKCLGSNIADGLGFSSTDGSGNALGDVLGQTGHLLALGDRTSCALSIAGELRCWGDNAAGEFGDGGMAPSVTPSLAQAGLRTVSSGATHACGITGAATLLCWGDNTYGQLGNGITGGASPTPVAVTGLANVVVVSAGTHHTCAGVSDGTLYCWGDNTYGQLGNGSHTASPIPVAVGVQNARVLAAGENHTCVSDTGQVRCWGRNHRGQLGNSTITDSASPVVAVNAPAKLLALGANHSCMQFDFTTGGIGCWGDNTFGQLGLSAATPNSTFNRQPQGISGVLRSMSAGGDHTCVVTPGGATLCTGRNDRGQVGDGTNASRFGYIRVAGDDNGGELVDAGGSHTCVLRIDGRIECWGRNDASQLGDGTVTSRNIPTPVEGGGQFIDSFTMESSAAIGATLSPAATATSDLDVSFTTTDATTCAPSGGAIPVSQGGFCVVDASQAGDAAFTAALPRQRTAYVPPQNANPLQFDPIPDRLLSDGPFTLSVSQVQGSPKAITVERTEFNTCNISGLVVTPITLGTCSFRARIAGDSTNLPQTILRSVHIQQTQTIDFPALADRLLTETPFTLAASASSGLGVVFTSLTPAVCTTSGDQAFLRATGTCTIRASQPGDAGNQAAAPVDQSFNVTSAGAVPMLTVTRSGGIDSIVSTPAGIDCGSTCTAALPQSVPGQPSTLVTLAVTVTDGSFVTFTNDDGPVSVQANPIRVSTKVNFTADRTVNAAFTPPGAISIATNGPGHVVSTPAGIDCTLCDFTFPAYTNVTLTAVAEPGSLFLGWDGGACNGQGATCVVAVQPTAQAAGATFAPTVQVVASYQLGDDDPGAVIGHAGNDVTVDETGAVNLARLGPATYAPGAVGRGIGMQFAGDSRYGVATAVLPVATNFVIEAWVKPSGAAQEGYVAYVGVPGSNGFGFSRTATGAYRGIVQQFTFGPGAPRPNEWTHVAMVRDNFQSRIYINGEIDSSVSLSDVNPASGSTTIGAAADGSAGFSGTIDDVRVLAIQPGTFSLDRLNLRHLSGDGGGTGTPPTFTFDPPGGHYPVGTVVHATITVPFLNEITSVDPACAIVTQSTTVVTCDVTMDENFDLLVLTAPHTPQAKHLTVTRTGGVDAIASTPAGIDCGATCEADFTESDPLDPATWIKLGVTVTDGSLVAIAGADTAPLVEQSPTRVSTTVNLGSNRTVGFTFTPPGPVQVAVTGSGSVTSNPAGIDCGTTCTFAFPGYSTPTLTATPGANSIFVRWDTVPPGACSGSGASCTLAISGSAQQVTAVFAPNIVEVARYRLGEDDVGAVLGGPAAQSTNEAAGHVNLGRSGSGAMTYVTGADGSGLAVRFSASPYYFANTPTLTAADGFGITAWVKPDAVDGGIVAYMGSPCCNGAGIVRQADGSYIGLLGGVWVVGPATGAPPQEWTHVAFIRANGHSQLYINGALVGDDANIGIGPRDPRTVIGQGLHGSVDDVRIFTIAGVFDPATLDVRRLALTQSGTGAAPAITLSPPGSYFPAGTVVHAVIDAAALTDIVSVGAQCVPAAVTPWHVECDITMNDNVDVAIVRQARAPQSVTIDVTRTGGLDPVVSTPAGIDCGATCSATFTESDPQDQNTWVTLAATVTDGSYVVFTGGDTPAEVTLNPTRVSTKVQARNRTIGVAFTQPAGLDVTITGSTPGRVVSSPAGIDCTSGTCSYVFPAYSTVTLTAMPPPGLAFGRWTGPDCAGQGAVCTLTIADASARHVSAEFRQPFELVASYRLGDADAGAASGGAGAATTKDSAGTADLTRVGSPTYAAGAVEQGLGMAFDGASVYQSPTLVLDEVANYGIEMWIDLGTDNQNVGLPVWVGDINYGGGYGLYQENNHVFGYTAADGNIIGSGGNRTGWNHYALVREGRMTRLYANGVLDGELETDDLPPPSSVGENKATSIGNTSYVDFGLTGRLDEVRFFRFAPGNFTPARLNVRTLAATVTGTAPTITYLPTGGAYPTGTVVRVTIAAAPGTVIQSFNPACLVVTQSASQVTCDITLADNADLTVATGTGPVEHTLTVARDGAGSGSVTSSPAGIDCGATCAFAFTQGTTVTLTANPAPGSTFTGWSGSGCSGTGTCAVTLNAPAAVTATFAIAKIAQSITFAPLGDRDLADTPFTLAATASSHLAVSFTSLTTATCTVTGTSVALVTTGTCTIRASQPGDGTYEAAADVDQSFDVTSGPAQAALTITKGGAGQGRVSGAGIDCGGDCSETFALGTVVTLTAASGSGATFAEWSLGACGSAPVCTFTMDADRTVQALFDAHTPAQPSVDFDDDGKADIVWTHADGRVAAWLMDGLTVAAGAEVVPAGSGWQVTRVADLDGDGRSDLVLQNIDGSVAVYLMNGTSAAATQLVLPAGGGWTVTQAADLDGDGKADLVFENADGTIAAYLMDGVTVRSGATLIEPGSGWSITKTGDFDGDGKADVLWTHTDGRVAIWLMNGLTVKSSTQILNAGSGWSVAHVADLDGDGKADLVWRNTDGTTAAWLMDGASMASGANVLGAGTGWTVTQMGDFDNDGNADLLWTHDDGRVAIYLMDGLTVKFTQQILNAGSGWHVAAVQDLDGDGKADIVWQHADGRVALWLMDGSVTMGQGADILGPGSGWGVTPAGP